MASAENITWFILQFLEAIFTFFIMKRQTLGAREGMRRDALKKQGKQIGSYISTEVSTRNQNAIEG